MEFTHCFQCMETVANYPCPHCGYNPVHRPLQSFMLRPGTILQGKYVIGAVLGQGGFGITYIGWDLALARKVAVKEYYPMGQVSRNTANSNALEWRTSEQSRLAQGGMEYFLKEGRKMARVADIPQVVNVLDIFQENETAYIVMSYSQGQTLKAYLKRNGPLSWAEAETIFLPVVNAMEQVHKAGLIHRDLSPDNLMLQLDGTVKILDLGAAKDLNINSGASSVQVAKGGFSPLEQYRQRGGSGPWSDVYALAATMYYSLTGALPPSAVDLIAGDILRWDLPQLTALPENVQAALQKAMAIFPEDRTQSMEEFASQLTTPVTAQQQERSAEKNRGKKPEGAPAPEKGPSVKEKAASGNAAVEKKEEPGKSPMKLRKRLPMIAAVLALLAVVGGILVWNTNNRPSGSMESENDPAQLQETEESSPTENNTEKALDDAPAKAYAAAETLANNGETAKAAMAFYALGDYQDARERSFALWDTVAVRDTISAGSYHTVALKSDSTVVAIGGFDQFTSVGWSDLCDVSRWNNVVAVSAGGYHTVGLEEAGTVVAVGENTNSQCDVNDWENIESISAGGSHTVGRKGDGTVVAVGENANGQCNVTSWKDIVAISAGSSHTVGLRADGTVVAVGSNGRNQCDVSSWTDIIAISAGHSHTVGLKADGTVVAAGSIENSKCDVSGWTDIVAISAGYAHTVGLRADGTVVAVGANTNNQCDTSNWNHIVAIGAGTYHTVGLRTDGTIVATGGNRYGQCNVRDWKDLMLPKLLSSEKPEPLDIKPAEKYATAETLAQNGEVAKAAMVFYSLEDYQDARKRCFELWSTFSIHDTVSAGDKHTVGLKEDGTVLAVGRNIDGQCSVNTWRNITSISAGGAHTVGLKGDGSVVAVGLNNNGQCNVNLWKDIVSISAGESHTVGLKADGTVVAVGMNSFGQCNVSEWTNIIAISAGNSHTVGLREDGTVVAAGKNNQRQCNVSDWTDIISVSAGESHTVGLKANGTVVAVGNNYDGQIDVSSWTEISAICAGYAHTVGLKSDGTVLAVGMNGSAQCHVNGWTDIVAISAGTYHTIGLKSGGNVVVTLCRLGMKTHEDGQCNVDDWRNIRRP